jgi:hypothetical protein
MPKKSKYDLTPWYNLKVPVDMAESLIELHGKDNWAEVARDLIQAGINQEKKER